MTLPIDLQQSITHEFRNQSLDQLENLKPSDVVVFDNQPIPENYTVVAHVDDKTSNAIVSIQDRLAEIDVQQYYYPAKQLHLTLLGNIKVTVDPELITRAVNAAFKTPIKFILYGLGSNQYCGSMSAYPHRFSITECRKILREIIGVKGDDYSIHLPAYENVGWINFMRYLHQPKEELLKELKANKESYFGDFVVKEISIYRNKSKVLDPDQSELIHTISPD